MKFTKLELKQRYEHLKNAIATQRLEGLEPDARTIEDLKCVVRGEIDIEEARAQVYERIKRGEL